MSRVVWRSAARTASRSAASPAGELSPGVVNAAPLSAVSSPTCGLADTCPDRPEAPSRLRTPRDSALDGASDAPLTASVTADYKRASLREPPAPAPMTSAQPRGASGLGRGALPQTTGARVASKQRGASTSLRPGPDRRDAFSAKAGSTAAPPAGIQPAATTGLEESLS
jgi:hypothetical protein